MFHYINFIHHDNVNRQRTKDRHIAPIHSYNGYITKMNTKEFKTEYKNSTLYFLTRKNVVTSLPLQQITTMNQKTFDYFQILLQDQKIYFLG